MQKNSITNKITPCCGLPFSVIYWWVSNLTLNSEADRQYLLTQISQSGVLSIDGWKVLINSGTLEADASLTKPDFLAWFDCGRQPKCEQLKILIEGFQVGNWDYYKNSIEELNEAWQNLEERLINENKPLYNNDVLANDIIERIDLITGENVNYREVTTWMNGSVMNDEKVDGVIYKKINGKYYKRQHESSVDVKWFGAVGDGITDDTLAIQKAFDFLFTQKEVNGLRKSDVAKVIIPSGSYRVTGTLQFPSGYVLQGKGKHISQIFYDNRDGNALEIKESKDQVNNYANDFFTEIRDLMIRGERSKYDYGVYPDDKRDSNNGIYLFQVLKVKFNNIDVNFFENANVYIDSCFYISFFDCYFRDSRFGIRTNGTSAISGMNVCTSVVVDNCEIRGNSIGFYLEKIYASTIVNSMIEQNFGMVNHQIFDDQSGEVINQNSVAVVLNKASSIRILNNYFEAHLVSFYLLNSNRNIISDNFVVTGDGHHLPNTVNPQNGRNYTIATFVFLYSSENHIRTNAIIRMAGFEPYNLLAGAASQNNIIDFISKSEFNTFKNIFVDAINAGIVVPKFGKL